MVVPLLLLCIFGCVGIVRVAEKNSEGQAPILRLRITVDESMRNEFFSQLQQFANQHSFEFKLRPAGPNGEGFFIEMTRDDIYINANITRVDPKTVSLRFFDTDPTHPTSKETVDDLLIDLKSFLSAIPNVTITEEE